MPAYGAKLEKRCLQGLRSMLGHRLHLQPALVVTLTAAPSVTRCRSIEPGEEHLRRRSLRYSLSDMLGGRPELKGCPHGRRDPR